jgi:hypothetical protein
MLCPFCYWPRCTVDRVDGIQQFTVIRCLVITHFTSLHNFIEGLDGGTKLIHLEAWDAIVNFCLERGVIMSKEQSKR